VRGVLPAFVIDESKIAPLHPFGVCCALAFFAWDHVGMKMAVHRGFDRADFRVFTVLIGIFGWSFAWIVDRLFYQSSASTGSLSSLQSLSSTGAILGATIAAVVWSRLTVAKTQSGRMRVIRRRPSFALLPISEVILATWPVAWAVGRLGCALVHDHVGRTVASGTLGSLLAVGFPRSADDGVDHVYGPLHVVTGGSDVRFDLGLLEFMFLAVLATAFALRWKKPVALGTYTVTFCLAYGVFRFGLDFLRDEVRHGGLTFAQYWSLSVVALGLAIRHRMSNAASATVD
jgi:phosphatidylglycerol---prolipoprotein diacylglyceryl transferase